jgi:hypothetical protein
VTRRKGPLARLRRFFTGPVGPVGVTGATGPAGAPASAERGFIRDSYDILLAVDERDGLDWLSKNRLYEGKLAFARPDAVALDGRIVRSVYATKLATRHPGYGQAFETLGRNQLKSISLFMEAPLAEPPLGGRRYSPDRVK